MFSSIVNDCYRDSVRGKVHIRGQSPTHIEVDGEPFNILTLSITNNVDASTLPSDCGSQSDD